MKKCAIKRCINLVFSMVLASVTQVYADRPSVSQTSNNQNSDNNETPDRYNSPNINTEPAMANALEIQAGETVAIVPMNFPSRGMSMRKVLDTLGKPNKTPARVGTPPIRLWEYNDRTIYFENMTVIHVVAKP